MNRAGTRRDLLAAGSLCLVSLLLLCWNQHAWSVADWSRPWYSGGDVLLLQSYMKAAAEGDGWHLGPRLIHRLNAPFVANWSDFPTVEELIWMLGGFYTRCFGLHAAYNLCLLTSHCLAGVAFYAAARSWGSRLAPAWLGALCFTASRYLFMRDRGHINLAFAWHVPLLWVGARLLWDRSAGDRSLTRKQQLELAFLCFVTAWQQPYYLYFWMLMLLPGACRAWAHRRPRGALPTLATMAGSVLCLLLSNLDTLLGWAQLGRSPAVFHRNLASLQLLGLRLPELVLPVGHRWEWLSQFSETRYLAPMGTLIGEAETVYLGWIGLACAAAVVATGARALLRAERPGFVFCICAWLLLVCLTGGLNLLAGVGGLLTFRATNRVSIVLLAGVLLEACRRSRHLPPRWQRAQLLVLPLALLAVWDQLPLRPDPSPTTPPRRQVAEDQAAVDQITSACGPSAMVFQWPLQTFPEPLTSSRFPDYEPLGLYLQSNFLRFSYGNCEGHWNSNWQAALSRLPPTQLLAQVEQFGFATCVLYPAALNDADRSAWQALEARANFTPERSRAVFLLHPPPPGQATLPPQLPALSYGIGWYPERLPDGYHVSAGYASCGLVGDGRAVDVDLTVRSPRVQQNLDISLNGRQLWSGPVGAAPQRLTLHLGPLRRMGNELIFLGRNAPPQDPDGRWTFFELGDESFRVLE